MQRKWKKAATAAMAGAIMAAQALMPVSAAGGSIDADMSTKTPVIRVVVPTQMAVAVNEFEMGDTGSQVTSEEFTMKNVSEIPVNVKVTSTATLGTGVTLVSTKAAAKESTDEESPAMWLAAAAAVADNSGTLEYLGGDAADKTAGALTGSEANVTAFATKDGASTAVQDFYLGAATSATYKAIIGTDAADIGEGADFYKMTSGTITDQDTLDAALEAQDVYTAAAAPVAGTGQALTRIAKGATATHAAGTQYYTMAAAPETYATVAADGTGVYLYIDTATTAAGDAAAFRYAGALSSAKSGWSTTDLSAITINYDITGVTTSAYDEIKDDLVYGYNGEADVITLEDGVLTVKINVADFKDGTLKIGDTVGALNTSAGTWGGEDGAVTFTFNSTWANAIKGQTCEVTVNLKDGTTSYTASFDVAE